MVAKDGAPLVLSGNLEMLKARALQLRLNLDFKHYADDPSFRAGQVVVLSSELAEPVVAGLLNSANSPYVIDHILNAADRVLHGDFSALITGPVHKASINKAGIAFSGHTELLADYFRVSQVVMMLASPELKVALVTNHLPLKEVPAAITKEKIIRVIQVLQEGLAKDFNIKRPTIYVSGLNPHAGEDGVLGLEEISTIIPALQTFASDKVFGPYPADTVFTPPFREKADAFLAMYHDQGLAVLKALSFGKSINITLGLPIKRLSVDHGTALDLAGSGLASASSLRYALELVMQQSSKVAEK
jgi:4-hydroxythreonine-4-phosphate dehydrogenase